MVAKIEDLIGNPGGFRPIRFLVFAALMCGGCQSPLPPLPNPPSPKTAVRLAPGDVIKVAYADGISRTKRRKFAETER